MLRFKLCVAGLAALLFICAASSAHLPADGVWSISIYGASWTIVMVNVTQEVVVAHVHTGNGTAGSADIGLGIARPGSPNVWDFYVTSGDWSISLDPSGDFGNVTTWNNLTLVEGSIKRQRVAYPYPAGGAPNFEGYYESSSSGRKMTCLRSSTTWTAYICAAAVADSYGAVQSETMSIDQLGGASVNTGKVATDQGLYTYLAVLSPDGNTLTLQDPSVSDKLNNTIDVFSRVNVSLPATQPPLRGLYRVDNSVVILGCGSPASARGAGLCMAKSDSGTTFTIVEVLSEGNILEYTSLGLLVTEWADRGMIKRSYYAASPSAIYSTGDPFPGVPIYRVPTLTSLRGTWVIGGINVTCSGSEDAITCAGAGLVSGQLTTFTMSCKGVGFGQYYANFAYQKGSGAVVSQGFIQVSPDGRHIEYTESDLPMTYMGLPEGSFRFP